MILLFVIGILLLSIICLLIGKRRRIATSGPKSFLDDADLTIRGNPFPISDSMIKGVTFFTRDETFLHYYTFNDSFHLSTNLFHPVASYSHNDFIIRLDKRLFFEVVELVNYLEPSAGFNVAAIMVDDLKTRMNSQIMDIYILDDKLNFEIKYGINDTGNSIIETLLNKQNSILKTTNLKITLDREFFEVKNNCISKNAKLLNDTIR